jgi:hypothetical protein
MSRLGFIPDFYYGIPMPALSTPGPGYPGPLGLTMVDRNPLLGCVGCGVPGPHAGPVAEAHLGYVIPDESPLGMTTGNLAVFGIVLGAFAGIGAGYLALRKRRRR